MPKSRIRKKADFTPPPVKTATVKLTARPQLGRAADAGVLHRRAGLDRAVLRHAGSLPVDAIGNWNIVVGFGFIAGGFVVSTQWK